MISPREWPDSAFLRFSALRQCCTGLPFGFKLKWVSRNRLVIRIARDFQGNAQAFLHFSNIRGSHLLIQQTMFRAGIISAVLLLGGCASTGSDSSGRSPDEPKLAVLESTLIRTGAEAERTHNFEAAVGYYARLLQLRPDDPAVAVMLARNLRYWGHAAKAIDLLNDEIKKHPDHAAMTLELGKAYLAAGRHQDAISTLEKASQIDPGNWQVYSALGIVHDSTGDFVSAQIEFEQGLVISPGNATILNNLAMSHAQAGRIDQAIKTLEQAATLERNNMQIRQNLALLYGIRGNSDKARALAAMDLEPKEVETNLSFYRRFGDTPQ